MATKHHSSLGNPTVEVAHLSLKVLKDGVEICCTHDQVVTGNSAWNKIYSNRTLLQIFHLGAQELCLL